jgi:hypothetical protein
VSQLDWVRSDGLALVRERLRALDFWWRNQVPRDAKIVLVVVVVVSLVVWAGVDRGADAGAPVRTPTSHASAGSGSIFASGFDDVLRRESILYERWQLLNPGEALEYERYADEVKLGLNPTPPELVTPLGRALVAAAQLEASSSVRSPR